jgi:GWxTD domain-containing protein
MVKLRIAVGALVALGFCACGISLMPSRDTWYTQNYFLLQDYERQVYKDLTPAGKAEFQKLYWSARIPAIKEEYRLRMDFISRTFQAENRGQPWNTDRARIYLLNGSPATIDYRQNNDWVTRTTSGASSVTSRSGEDVSATSVEVWTYPYGPFFVYYGFAFDAPNKWKAVQIGMGDVRHLSELEVGNRRLTFGPADEEDYKKRLEALKAVK